jgi:hypothetical protein
MTNADEHTHPEPARRLSRRSLLGGVAGAAAAGGLASVLPALDGTAAAAERAPATVPSPGAVLDALTARPALNNPAAPAYRSRPDLLPPKLQASVVQSDPTAGFLIITPSALPSPKGLDPAADIAAGLGQPGLMIADERGELVWFQSTSELATNLQVQSYEGKPVLTYWSGAEAGGIGFGTGYVLDTSYRQIATVKAGNGVQADLHELQLTPQGSALVTGYVKRAADLSAIGGPKRGVIWDSVVQEIEVKTGKVVLDWRALDHVPVTASYAAVGPQAQGGSGLGTAASPFDYFHVNSVALYGESELIVSARNTWALYRLERRTGALIARINGRSSDYKMGPGTAFYWQHHARLVRPGLVTLFDDGAVPPKEAHSRGLVLAVNDAARTVSLAKAFVHPAGLLTPYEGSMQLLGDGGAVVGFGGQPYLSQFAPNGALVWDGRLPTGAQSYRAFRSTWVGAPASPPDVVLQNDTLRQTVVYVSWNGATQVATWQVLTGKSAASLEVVATVPRAGFETAISTRPTGSVLVVAGLDAHGRRLGVSKPLAVPPQPKLPG